MRRDLKNNLYFNRLNSDADGDFTTAATWNTGRVVCDLMGHPSTENPAQYQMVDRFMVYIVVTALTAAKTIVWFMEEAAANSEASFTEIRPFQSQYTIADLSVTSTGVYYAEYRNTKRYVRLSCRSMTATPGLTCYAVLAGTSTRMPVDRSHMSPL